MDKGLHGFKRNVGLSILAYNLHILGNALKNKALENKNKKAEQLHKKAA
jgi:SRSO17 transposase